MELFSCCRCGGKASIFRSFDKRGHYSDVMCAKCSAVGKRSYITIDYYADEQAMCDWNALNDPITVSGKLLNIDPAHLTEICAAEREGRLIVLPEGLTEKLYASIREDVENWIKPIYDWNKPAARAAMEKEGDSGNNLHK